MSSSNTRSILIPLSGGPTAGRMVLPAETFSRPFVVLPGRLRAGGRACGILWWPRTKHGARRAAALDLLASERGPGYAEGCYSVLSLYLVCAVNRAYQPHLPRWREFRQTNTGEPHLPHLGNEARRRTWPGRSLQGALLMSVPLTELSLLSVFTRLSASVFSGHVSRLYFQGLSRDLDKWRVLRATGRYVPVPVHVRVTPGIPYEYM